MKKGIYRSVAVKEVDEAKLQELVRGKSVVVSVDVAKEDCFGLVGTRDGAVATTVRWRQPTETAQLVRFVRALPGSSVEVAMEPTGTYGDALRWQLGKAGVPVFCVSPKRCHDAAEVYDGVPSMHDAKAAAVIAKLHIDGASRRWEEKSEADRDLRASVEQMRGWDEQYHSLVNRIEGMLAAHWPELPHVLALTSATLLVILERFGTPQALHARAEEARALMRCKGGRWLSQTKIDEIVSCARDTTGVPMTIGEEERLVELAREATRCRSEARRARRKVERLGAKDAAVGHIGKVVGKATAAVLVAAIGRPSQYASAGAWIKASGLNLKERSSGKHRGQLKITKRGPGIVRWYSYLAVLRLIQKDDIVRAWYARKVQRDGGRFKGKAIVAVMRKLVAALWHVGRGAAFDSRLLFDTRKLSVAA